MYQHIIIYYVVACHVSFVLRAEAIRWLVNLANNSSVRSS